MKSLKNQKGVLAFDFLFGFMFMASFFMLIVILSFTLSAVEVLQYIAFATSRSYVASDVSEGKQKKAARDKYEYLINGGIFKMKPEWFNLPDKDDNKLISNNKKVGDRGIGTYIEFNAKILSVDLPFLGDTTSGNFISSVNSYIGREPPMNKCQEFVRNRPDLIMEMDNGDMYKAYQSEMQSSAPIWDNGC